MRMLNPPSWPRPKGYSNGIEVTGRQIYVSGQVGWDETETFVSDDFADQFEKVLENTLAVLAEAGAGPEHIVRMTGYITSREDYLAAEPKLGTIWKQLMGKNFPVMAFVIVAGLIEKEALVEIETTAVISD
ncbi:MAG: enamine deaminase RidA [Hyphobacterium sp.]|nr:MAG: enamine deaminase RidA [Hyphobacterium sp.]